MPSFYQKYSILLRQCRNMKSTESDVVDGEAIWLTLLLPNTIESDGDNEVLGGGSAR